eukprot:scaffold111285_cov21-Tisochrysis_lutea.AAC.1
MMSVLFSCAAVLLCCFIAEQLCRQILEKKLAWVCRAQYRMPFCATSSPSLAPLQVAAYGAL